MTPLLSPKFDREWSKKLGVPLNTSISLEGRIRLNGLVLSEVSEGAQNFCSLVPAALVAFINGVWLVGGHFWRECGWHLLIFRACEWMYIFVSSLKPAWV